MTPIELDLSKCYVPNGTREFDRDTIEGLRKSLNHAHAVNQKLIRNVDRQEKRIARLSLVAWISSAAAVGAWALVGTLIGLLLER